MSYLVPLNHERAADLSAAALRAKEEEAEGRIHWLRPEYQDPDYQPSTSIL